MKKFLIGMALSTALTTTHAQFVAVNDHASGTGTSPNATIYNILGNEDGPTGPLKDVNTGTTLPVTLNILRTGFVLAENGAADPAAGTPLAQTFNGLADFTTTGADNARIANSLSSVSYVISNLNPNVTYLLQGGAVVGSSFTDHYTKFSLVGADNFVNQHTANAITSSTAGSGLAANQVAINTGQNHLPGTGDMFQWDSVNPGSDGVVTIRCEVYGGPIPGGTAANNYGNGLTALRIVEQVDAPPVIVQDPESVVASVGASATFSVLASGFPLNYQWLRNGNPISGANGASFTIPVVNSFDNGAMFSVIVSNSLGTATSAEAELIILAPPVTLLAFNKNWRYENSGRDLGTGWREVDFVDTSWALGPGPLGLETTPENLPIPLGTTFPSLNSSITYYFRTTFVFNGNPNDVELVATNLLDDGAVYYLNGVEVFRSTILGTDPIDAFSPAAPAVGDAAFETAILSADSLITGTNLLAVEMHQANTTSSDLVFGLHLRANFLPPGPLTLLTQPEDVVVEENKSFTLSVEVEGNAARYQWFKDGEMIPGATRRQYTVEFANPDEDAGVYQVRIRNPFTDILSETAIVTVIPDVTPPVLLTADGSRNRTNILVSYSENVTQATATNAANYQLKTSIGQTLNVISGILTNGTNVLLTTAAREPDPGTNNYLLVVNNVSDLASIPNIVATNSTVPVFRILKLVGVHRTWRFYDPFPFFPLNHPLFPGDGWEQPVFTENNIWATGPAPFVYDGGNNELPVDRQVQTLIDQGSITKYFRSGFDFNASTLGAVFRMKHIVDDGAIFYLNGTEFLRYNLPEGLVDENTAVPAANGVTVARLVTVETPTELLQLGTNVLAVELHGTNQFDIDYVFTMDFEVRYNSVSQGPIIITRQPGDQTVTENQPVQFTFDGVGPSGYQWYVNGNLVQGANNATFTLDSVPLSLNNAIVHVVAMNTGYTVTSSNALLTVEADIEAPLLLSAVRTNSNQVLIQFSEPILESTAVFAGNYSITTPGGDPVGISGAMLLESGDTVLLTASEPLLNQPYSLTVNNIADIAATPNIIAPNSGAIIGFRTTLIAIDENHMWRYFESPTDPGFGSAWKEFSYPDADAWPQGPALLGEEGSALPEPLRTDLSVAENKVTFFFRTEFNVEGDPDGTTLELTEIIDDGVIFYLNGDELKRSGMPAGAVSWNTFASRTVGNAGVEGPTVVPSTSLQQGVNVLAAEVHQTSAGSSDIVFGAKLEQVFNGGPLSCPELSIQRLPNGNVQISWATGSSCVLEQALSVTGPWLTVPSATNPYVVPAPTVSRYYRLRHSF